MVLAFERRAKMTKPRQATVARPSVLELSGTGAGAGPTARAVPAVTNKPTNSEMIFITKVSTALKLRFANAECGQKRLNLG